MGNKALRTEYLAVNPVHPDPQVLEHCGEILRQGGLVAFPTETVYGLGANGLDTDAVRKIYHAKGRPSDNPLILHVDSVAMLKRLTTDLNPLEEELIRAYWPGPLTLVLPKADIVPHAVTGGGTTVAVRMPAHPVARALIRAAGVPLAAPSANASGRPSPCRAESVRHDLQGRVEAILDGGPTGIGLESTVVSCREGGIVIYRPGAITAEMLALHAPTQMDAALVQKELSPKAPGMKYRHYAPNIPVQVLMGTQEQIAATMKREYRPDCGYFVSKETASCLPTGTNIYTWGEAENQKAMAAQLFEALLFLENQDVREIWVEGTPEEKLGVAIMNRLYKSANGKIWRV